MKKRIDPRKIVQILSVYAFALVAAVACGDSFAVKNANGGSFGIARAAKSVTAGSSVTIEYIIADRANGATIAVQHSPDSLEGFQEHRVGNVIYSVNDVCRDSACNEVGVLVSRVDTSTSPALVSQSAFYIEGAGPLMAVKHQRHGTVYDFPQDALALGVPR